MAPRSMCWRARRRSSWMSERKEPDLSFFECASGMIATSLCVAPSLAFDAADGRFAAAADLGRWQAAGAVEGLAAAAAAAATARCEADGFAAAYRPLRG